MAKPKFKVGDKVLWCGTECTVVSRETDRHGGGVYYRIVRDRDGERFTTYESWDALTLFSSATTYATSATTVTIPDSSHEHWPVGTVITYDPKKGPPATAPNPNPKKAFGETKPNLALVPPAMILHAAMAFEAGARKYGAYNFRHDPVENMTYIAAAMRHLQNYLDGEEYCADDPTVHNLAAAIAGLGIVLDGIECKTLIDNRPPAGRSSEVQERMKAQKVERSKGEIK